MKRAIVLATIREKNIKIDITIEDYYGLIKEKNKPKIAEMVYYRFFDRYIQPFSYPERKYKDNYKHGFAMMASCCLMIEALESFYQGLESTKRKKGEDIFKSFFTRHKSKFNFNTSFFYNNVRCGILHQAETTGGILISRDGKLYDEKTKSINATLFMQTLKKILEEYKAELEQSEWDSEIWDNLRTKMRHIIRHCENK